MYFRLSRSLAKSTIRLPYLPYYCPTKPPLEERGRLGLSRP